MNDVQEQPKNEALLSLRDTGPGSLVERADNFIISMGSIVADSEVLIPAANDFTVTTEAEFAFADELRVELESQAKQLEAQRMVITRPIDDLKSFLMSAVKPAIDNNKRAAAIYNAKALAFRRQEKAKAEAARLEAERIQRETQARLEAEAKKKEEAASKLKTDKARQAKMEEADALRQAAIHTPVSMAVSAPAPQATASNVVDKWLWNIDDFPAFIKWLTEHPEWLNKKGSNNCVIGEKVAAMNKIVNHYADTLEIPGVRVWSEEAFRKKASR